jgi:hypothetical protein
MAKHFELTEPNAIHPAAFVGVTDPSLDPDNFVEANKLWIDTSGGLPYSLKVRNVTNTAWVVVSGSGTSSSAVAAPPGFQGDEGETGEVGPPGPSTASSGSGLPPATATGQVLYSINGTTFTAQLPLTDPATGWLVDGVTGLLLVA